MLKKLLLAAAAFAVSAPVFADHGYDKHYWKHHRYYAPRPVIVMPPPRVYYTPPPAVYVAPPAPVYYTPPPAVYRPAPVYPQSGVSIRFHFPL